MKRAVVEQVTFPFSSDLQFPRTVAERFPLRAELVQHAQEKIRHGGLGRSGDVAVALKLARGASYEHDGQWIVIVLVSIAHAAAVQDH